MWDAKLLRRKGKERHLFLFEQALLVTKEVKDVDGKVVYLYKYKLKVGITQSVNMPLFFQCLQTVENRVYSVEVDCNSSWI
jgi:hypothetical protein